MSPEPPTPGGPEAVNRAFYDALYEGPGPLGRLFRARVSFDQRSKAGPNLEALRPVLAGADPSRALRLLDYGCGWGTLLLALRRHPVEPYGYDLAPAAVPGLRRAARLIGSDIRQAPVGADGFYDVVVCSHVLEHVPDDRALLAELHDALAPGGHLLVNVPVNEVVEDPKHARAYTSEAVEAVLAEAGFEVLDRREVDRWTAFLLKRAEGAGPVGRAALRLLRGLLALPPWRWVESAGERLLASRYPRQQLVVLCRKAEGG